MSEQRSYPETLYLCDPRKFPTCPKTACYRNPRSEYGTCRWSNEKKHSKDGLEYIYNSKTGKVERK